MSIRVSLFFSALMVSALAFANEVWLDPKHGIPFVLIPKGCFEMGRNEHHPPPESSAWDQLSYAGSQSFDERPKHKVCVDSFWMGVFEVRASDWVNVMGTPPPFGSGDQPASGVSWSQAQTFIVRLNHSSTTNQFRLPTEAEWEYACRAGRKRDYFSTLYGGDPIGEFAWFNDPPRQDRHYAAKPVGKRRANEWGVHDILGNAWEWTQDAYFPDGYKSHKLWNPLVLGTAGGDKVIRGGSYRSQFAHIRCGNRSRYPEDESLPQIGLRLVAQRLQVGARK